MDPAPPPDYSVVVYNLTADFKIVAGDSDFKDVLPFAVAVNDTVEPMSWESMGGGGSLRLLQRQLGAKVWMMVVRQTAEIHSKVKDALTGMKP